MDKALGHAAHVRADKFIGIGNSLEDEGKLEEALEKYREAVRVAPAYARARLNEGNALLALKRPEEAATCYRHAIRLAPDYAHAHFNLGNALQALKHPSDAISAYEEALRCNPGLAEAQVAKGAAHEEMENTAQAMAAYQAALAIQPDFAEARYNLALLYFQQRNLDLAASELEHALQLKPDYPQAREKLASTYVQMGFSQEALAQLREARRLEPENHEHHSHYLLTMNYPGGISDDEVFQEHVAYGEKLAAGPSLPATYPNDPSPTRRLRVGYVSGDFRQHPVLRFIEPLLEKHHRDEVEVFCYYTHDKPDVITEKLKALADQWREAAELDVEAMTNLIRDDQIDILVDLSGHTGYHRLAVFAHKPAPVQATWLGYLGTTGLKAMDYRICDHFTDPPGLTEKYHTEKLARLPDCQWCYRLPLELPSPMPLPMLANGHITFGSFNNIAKLNDQVLLLWARLLQAIPAARLLIAAMPLSARASSHIIRIFESRGVPRKRLDFRSRTLTTDYLLTCQQVDIALDPFPYNGGTTSIDTLCLGVPIITLAGTRSIARGGVTLLSNLGLNRFIAGSEGEYIDIARYWAANPAELAAQRATLPARVAASPLMDEERFASNMEQLYRTMWITWIKEKHK